MPAVLLDGRALARRIRARVGEECTELARREALEPGLAVVLVGVDPASQVYVGKKEEAAREAGMNSRVVRLDSGASQDEVLAAVGELGDDPSIHGLLVQLPLPRHLDVSEVQHAVPPSKDVDGLHPENAGRLLLGRDDALVPCTPRGVMALVDETGIDPSGKKAVVVGRSAIVGKPAALLLLQRNATVTVCHSRTSDLERVCREADILVAAVGAPGFISEAHVGNGATVIDVGINSIRDEELAARLLSTQPKRLERFRRKGSALVGDVDFGAAVSKARYVTPVPGGVGPLTVAMLLDNTLIAARRALGLSQPVGKGAA